MPRRRPWQSGGGSGPLRSLLVTRRACTPTDEETGQKHPMLTPGAMVGEMSLFRGGVRYCDMIGRGNGALAALLYTLFKRCFAKHEQTHI